MSVTVHHGDSRDVLKGMADGSIDSVVCDPPYALVSIGKRFGKDGAAPAKAGKTGAYARASSGFMGQKWDTGETAFDPAFWGEVLRVLKPGGHLLAFSGTRTYHRLACAIEDAGFEIRDMTAWLYGSGFPKSHDVSKAIDKALGAKRAKVRVPASQARNPKAAGGGKDGAKGAARPFIDAALEAGFHEAVSPEAVSPEAVSWSGWGTALKPAMEPVVMARKPLDGTVAANVLAHGCGALNVEASRVVWQSEADAAAAAAAAGFADSRARGTTKQSVFGKDSRGPENNYDPIALRGRWPANVLHDGSDEVRECFPTTESGTGAVKRQSASDQGGNTGAAYGAESRPAGTPTISHGDSGSAARFFYSAKADAEDRLGSKHPTVKPVDLMAYLCRLVTPPGGTVLDPFAGSGTTGLAAMREGFSAVLIEREEQYVADIHRRLKWARGEGRLTAQEKARHQDDAPLGGLFASLEPDVTQGGQTRTRLVYGDFARDAKSGRPGRQIGPTGLKR